jgi:hypothetical protein
MRRNQISSFALNGRVHLNRPGGGVSSVDCWQPEVCGISGSNAGYTVFRGSVKSTGYPLHSPVSLFTSPPVRHRVPSHFSWTLTLLNKSFKDSYQMAATLIIIIIIIIIIIPFCKLTFFIFLQIWALLVETGSVFKICVVFWWRD